MSHTSEHTPAPAPRVKDHEILRVYLPQLPDPSAPPESMVLADRIFFENVGESLTELQADGSTRHRAIEAVTMSLDGLTYRITLRKGMRFHCGAEVTADDAVACMLRVLNNRNSASQLHRFVAQNRSGSLELAVQAVSRYRLEVHLERRVSDFLQRLSLPEFTLRHDGRSCFSGPWKVSGSDENGIVLAPHTDHPDAAQSDYKIVRIENLDADQVGNLNFSGVPFAFVYDGTFCKSPPQEFLQDETVRNSHAGRSCFFRCERPDHIPVEVRRCLTGLARRFFADNSLWRRSPLLSAVPDGHLAHIPFNVDAGGEACRGSHRFAVDAGDAGLPDRVLDSFRKFVLSESGIELDFAAGSGRDGPVDLQVESLVTIHPADIYSPLSQEVRHPKLLKSSVIVDTEMKRKAPVVGYLQNLVRDGHYIPFVYVPWVVRSNRPVRIDHEGGSCKILDFMAVAQSESRSRRRKVQDKSLQAIGNAVQMFVHDVKRPFSLVQGILSLLESTDDSRRIREIVRKYVPDVKRTIKSVDGLIQDILEIGSDAEPACEDVAFGRLLVDVFADVFIFEKDAEVDFRFEFGHSQMLFADSHKLNRVIQNLVTNALQAMKRRGQIWVSTKSVSADDGQGFAQICVGNSNSYIPPNRISGLFERFYTEGNKKVTGLGLAISHKIITDHGGRIWCESDEMNGTRFYFTIPLAAATDPTLREKMPANARALQPGPAGDAAESSRRTLRLAQSGLSVLMLDDDRLYLEVIRELLTADEQAGHNITFTSANEFQKAVAAFHAGAKDGPFDIVIADVDLGTKGETGLDFVREIRRTDARVRICVHSNGSPFELQRKVLEAGGDLFLPKPMTRDHLVSLLESAAKDRQVSVQARQLAIVDDDALMIEMWESLGTYGIRGFFSPEEFLAACDAEPGLLEDFACIISDYTFPESDLDGLDLIHRLKERRFNRPLLLMTDRPMSPEQVRDCILLPKDIQKGLAYLRTVL
jgi:signal transduction histidine kinase/FixJ family two-component response regulator